MSWIITGTKARKKEKDLLKLIGEQHNGNQKDQEMPKDQCKIDQRNETKKRKFAQMTTDMGLGKGRYLKKAIEKKLMDADAKFMKEMKFIVEKNRAKVPKGAEFGHYGRWVKK